MCCVHLQFRQSPLSKQYSFQRQDYVMFLVFFFMEGAIRNTTTKILVEFWVI